MLYFRVKKKQNVIARIKIINNPKIEGIFSFFGYPMYWNMEANGEKWNMTKPLNSC